jgi:hypothetical protein
MGGHRAKRDRLSQRPVILPTAVVCHCARPCRRLFTSVLRAAGGPAVFVVLVLAVVLVSAVVPVVVCLRRHPERSEGTRRPPPPIPRGLLAPALPRLLPQLPLVTDRTRCAPFPSPTHPEQQPPGGFPVHLPIKNGARSHPGASSRVSTPASHSSAPKTAGAPKVFHVEHISPCRRHLAGCPIHAQRLTAHGWASSEARPSSHRSYAPLPQTHADPRAHRVPHLRRGVGVSGALARWDERAPKVGLVCASKRPPPPY